MATTRRSTVVLYDNPIGIAPESARKPIGVRYNVTTDGGDKRILVTLTRWTVDDSGVQTFMMFRDTCTLLNLRVPRVMQKQVDEVHAAWTSLCWSAALRYGAQTQTKANGDVVLVNSNPLDMTLPSRIFALIRLVGAINVWPIPKELPAYVPEQIAVEG
jgi:hypothetical protein